MGTLQFPELGQHCSMPDCGLNDFLPFTCDKCSNVYCLDHRGYDSHSCSNAARGDATVIICPLCGASIHLAAEHEPNAVWNHHAATSCNPERYAAALQKKKCPVKGCKEALKSSNTVRCKDCSVETCLKHRFGPDHACQGRLRKAPSSSSSMTAMWESSSQYGEKLFGSLQSSVASLGLTGPATGTASAGRGTAAGGASRHNTATNATSTRPTSGVAGPQRSSTQGGRGRGSNSTVSRNSRPQGVVTSDPLNTVRGSAAQRMQQQSGGGPGQGGREVCPQCSARFSDPVALVDHVKRAHEGSGPDGSNCVIS